MPDLVLASSNTARTTRNWTHNARPYINLLAVALAAASPALGGLLLAAILWLASAVISLAIAIRALAIAGRSVARITRSGRTLPLWLVAILSAAAAALVTWLVIRWLDRRRAIGQRS